jgi:regulator of replication initiation timing
VGDQDAQQAQLSQVTKEATAKALLITIRKLQSLKAERQRLEESSASLLLELDAARQALTAAQASATAAAQAEAAAAAAATSERQAVGETAAAAAAGAAADRAALVTATEQLLALQLEARQAGADHAAAAAHSQQLEQRVVVLQSQLAAAQSAAAELQHQLDCGRLESEALRQQLTAAAGEAEGSAADAEHLRAARAALSQVQCGARWSGCGAVLSSVDHSSPLVCFHPSRQLGRFKDWSPL